MVLICVKYTKRNKKNNAKKNPLLNPCVRIKEWMSEISFYSIYHWTLSFTIEKSFFSSLVEKKLKIMNECLDWLPLNIFIYCWWKRKNQVHLATVSLLVYLSLSLSVFVMIWFNVVDNVLRQSPRSSSTKIFIWCCWWWWSTFQHHYDQHLLLV